jgi:hypothetical protein
MEFALQRADLLAERWLLHAQPFGGTRDVTFVRDRQEIPDVAKFQHGGSSLKKRPAIRRQTDTARD